MEHKKPPFLAWGESPQQERCPAGWLRWRLRQEGRAGWVGSCRAPGPGQQRPHLARGGSSGGHGQARAQAAGPSEEDVGAAPTAARSNSHWRPGNEEVHLSRPPPAQGCPSSRRKPCGAGSCSWRGVWCWQRAAPSPSTGQAAGCAPWGLPGVLCPNPSFSAYTSRSLPPATDTVPAAPTEPSTEPPTAAALPLPGPAMPAAPAGREPAGFLGSVQQPCASHHVRMEGVASSPASATALQGGRATPVRQMWMNAALGEAAVPRAASTRQEVTIASAARATAPQPTGGSVCPRAGPPVWLRAPQQAWTVL
ncbi:epidermal growth factor-like protein 7 isoform X1 [Ochotona princeps]|uniref:epidermal growth factor-like protein 7 isoform X1 n=1 Tax=Ochotona princeps TaxID=9978 RepID=UPI002714FC91|nr:epidermal growth factor-like protein 7 isoform X1 [Ochotona princeps]